MSQWLYDSMDEDIKALVEKKLGKAPKLETALDDLKLAKILVQISDEIKEYEK
jgi:F0F1-type ATP synthase delta subunit